MLSSEAPKNTPPTPPRSTARPSLSLIANLRTLSVGSWARDTLARELLGTSRSDGVLATRLEQILSMLRIYYFSAQDIKTSLSDKLISSWCRMIPAPESKPMRFSLSPDFIVSLVVLIKSNAKVSETCFLCGAINYTYSGWWRPFGSRWSSDVNWYASLMCGSHSYALLTEFIANLT